jgi:hypothetical protein
MFVQSKILNNNREKSKPEVNMKTEIVPIIFICVFFIFVFLERVSRRVGLKLHALCL